MSLVRLNNQKMFNILYVHQDGQVTGSALSLRNMLLGIDRSRFQPRVLLAKDGAARQLFESLGVPVTTVPIHGMWTAPGPQFPKSDYFLNWLSLLPNFKLITYLRKNTPNLIHINDKAMLPAGLAAKILGIPIVWHIRSTYSSSNSKLQAYISAQIIRRIADHLIVISEDEVDEFSDLSKVSIIYNSVDFDKVDQALNQGAIIRKEMGINGNEKLIGTVSTVISENRGSWDFIKAAGLLQAALPDVRLRFVIVAKIPNPKIEIETLQRAEEAGIRQQLILTGFRNDVLSIMAAMDIVTICTRLGVLGRTPFEAMALGRPLVVTSGHSGCSRVVINRETGLIVPPVDPVTMADSMALLLKDPDLSQRLARKGAVYAREHFDPIRNSQAVMKIYTNLLLYSSLDKRQ